MGLDLSIEARIIHRKTEQVISFSEEDVYVCDEDKGFFEICWWCGWEFVDLRNKIIAIANQYHHSHYSESDLIIPILQEALREVYVCLLNHAHLADNTEFNWEMRDLYESTNLLNAKKLHDLIQMLHEIEYHNEILFERSICAFVKDWEDFTKHPQDFRWEFRLFNSY